MLANDAGIKTFQISVETYKDVVQLSGFVDRQELKNKAEEITRNVQGVVDVKNNILIKGQNSTQP